MPRPAPKRRFPAQPLTEDEVMALLNRCSTRAPTGIRNRALIAVLYRCGLRISEALDLRVSDVDARKGTVRVLHGKGNKARTVGIDAGGLAMVQRWADVRASRGIKRGNLFCTLEGARVSDRYVRDMLKRLAAKAGIDKRVHPHGLRHTHFSELAEEGVPINVISKQAGHSNSAVTARYIDHIAPASVIAMGRAREWHPDA
jgi:site-specific recombinase XerD